MTRVLGFVQVRLSGDPDDVDQVVQRLTAEFAATPPSQPYRNRTDPTTVRVYLKVAPQ